MFGIARGGQGAPRPNVVHVFHERGVHWSRDEARGHRGRQRVQQEGGDEKRTRESGPEAHKNNLSFFRR